MRSWGITDGSGGMVSQVRGVLEALGGDYTLKTCRRAFPFGLLPGWLTLGALQTLTKDSDALTPPWPEVIVTSGRRSAAFALAIKKASDGKTLAVHLTDPRISARHFDLVAAMAHDPVQGENVMHTRFALHSLTQAKLQAAHAEWAPNFADLPHPRVAVLIGGSTNKYTLGMEAMRALVAQLQKFQAATGASLLITPSRRTGEGNMQILLSSFPCHPERSEGSFHPPAKIPHCVRDDKGKDEKIYIYNFTGPNPYLGMLACGNAVIVTNDSVNMMSEAAYTQKPLYILPLQGHCDTKPARFAEMLIREGIARPLGNTLENWSYAVPDERAAVAAAIQALLAKRSAISAS